MKDTAETQRTLGGPSDESQRTHGGPDHISEDPLTKHHRTIGGPSQIPEDPWRTQPNPRGPLEDPANPGSSKPCQLPEDPAETRRTPEDPSESQRTPEDPEKSEKDHWRTMSWAIALTGAKLAKFQKLHQSDLRHFLYPTSLSMLYGGKFLGQNQLHSNLRNSETKASWTAVPGWAVRGRVPAPCGPGPVLLALFVWALWLAPTWRTLEDPNFFFRVRTFLCL